MNLDIPCYSVLIGVHPLEKYRGNKKYLSVILIPQTDASTRGFEGADQNQEKGLAAQRI